MGDSKECHTFAGVQRAASSDDICDDAARESVNSSAYKQLQDKGNKKLCNGFFFLDPTPTDDGYGSRWMCRNTNDGDGCRIASAGSAFTSSKKKVCPKEARGKRYKDDLEREASSPSLQRGTKTAGPPRGIKWQDNLDNIQKFHKLHSGFRQKAMGVMDAGATDGSESGGGGGGLDDTHHGSGDKMAQRNVGSDGGAEEGLNPSYGEAVVPVGEVHDWNTGVPVWTENMAKLHWDGQVPGWLLKYDPESKHPFYENIATGEGEWATDDYGNWVKPATTYGPHQPAFSPIVKGPVNAAGESIPHPKGPRPLPHILARTAASGDQKKKSVRFHGGKSYKKRRRNKSRKLKRKTKHRRKSRKKRNSRGKLYSRRK
jgi:hypothetical protein